MLIHLSSRASEHEYRFFQQHSPERPGIGHRRLKLLSTLKHTQDTLLSERASCRCGARHCLLHSCQREQCQREQTPLSIVIHVVVGDVHVKVNVPKSNFAICRVFLVVASGPSQEPQRTPSAISAILAATIIWRHGVSSDILSVRRPRR